MTLTKGYFLFKRLPIWRVGLKIANVEDMIFSPVMKVSF